MIVLRIKAELSSWSYGTYQVRLKLIYSLGYKWQFVNQAGCKWQETDEKLEPTRTLRVIWYFQRLETLPPGWTPVFRGIQLRSGRWRQTDAFLHMLYRGRLSIVNLCANSPTLWNFPSIVVYFRHSHQHTLHALREQDHTGKHRDR
jgi:hypothetical protein